MANRHINEQFLSEFFGISAETPDGQRELREIGDRLHRLQFENGQDICAIDGDPDGMFFLESGTAVVLDRDGEQINILHEGQYFGEYAVLAQQKRLSTVRSLGRTIVYKLDTADVMQILPRHPELYGELMKRVYTQVSGKHLQVQELSRVRKGILQHPGNRMPMSKRQMLVHYGILLLLYVLSALLLPRDAAGPVFLLPLGLMLLYVSVTRRTVESLAAAGIYAAVLFRRSGLAVSYVDALMETMQSPDNVYTVLVMALMGGMVALVEASGAVTAFKKLAEQKVRGRRSLFFISFAIMAVTAIDDTLNMVCSAYAVGASAKQRSIPRETLSVPYSLLPTVLCSFVPVSLYSIFVIGTLNVSLRGQATEVFLHSIPFNFYSVLVTLAMLLFSAGRLPLPGAVRRAEKRVQAGGALWPENSGKYLSVTEPELWGKLRNVMLPIVVLGAASVTARSLFSGRLELDSACGLAVALMFTFFLYCMQGLMSPEQFLEHLVSGISESTLPIILYLMTICLSTLLERLQLNGYFEYLAALFGRAVPLIPALLFLVSVLLTILLGSSWAMYAIAFPVAVRLSAGLSIPPALLIGAVSAAGIAGEHNCLFTAAALNVGTVVGCSPEAVLRTRIAYSLPVTCLAFLLYLAAGFRML